MQGQICWCKFAMTKFRRNIVIHRSAIVTSGLYQLTSYRVLTKMMTVEEWYLENEYVLIKFQKIYRHSSIYAINVGTNKKRCRCTITKKWKPWIFLILVYLLLLGVSLFIYRTFWQTILKDITLFLRIDRIMRVYCMLQGNLIQQIFQTQIIFKLAVRLPDERSF